MLRKKKWHSRNERRNFLDARENGIRVRGKMNPISNLVDFFDDRRKRPARSWKDYRKNQYK